MIAIRRLAALAALAVVMPGMVSAAAPPATTRYAVSMNRINPGSAEAWRKVYKETYVPALKKTGVPSYSVGEVIFGGRPMFVHVRSLDKFAELDAAPLLQQAGLTQKQIDAANAIRNAALVSEDRFVVNVQNEFVVATTPGTPIRVVQYLRPNPGEADALRALLKSDLLPAWQQAKQAGRIAGAGMATTGQGRPGLTVTWVDYANLAALDAGNAIQQTMGAAPFALFQARLAQVAHVEDSMVTRREADLSYANTN
jgi:hypothetical protein